jgi:hypothetical protein
VNGNDTIITSYRTLTREYWTEFLFSDGRGRDRGHVEVWEEGLVLSFSSDTLFRCWAPLIQSLGTELRRRIDLRRWGFTRTRPAWERRYEPEWGCGAYWLRERARTADERTIAKIAGVPADFRVCLDACVYGIGVEAPDVDVKVEFETVDEMQAWMVAWWADALTIRKQQRVAGRCDCGNLMAAACPVHVSFGEV